MTKKNRSCQNKLCTMSEDHKPTAQEFTYNLYQFIDTT